MTTVRTRPFTDAYASVNTSAIAAQASGGTRPWSHQQSRLDVRVFGLPVVEARLAAGGFEQLDGVAGGVIDHDLFAAHAGDQIAAQMNTGLTEPVHSACQIVSIRSSRRSAGGWMLAGAGRRW